jgi:hypothetical protein
MVDLWRLRQTRIDGGCCQSCGRCKKLSAIPLVSLLTRKIALFPKGFRSRRDGEKHAATAGGNVSISSTE